MNKRTKWITILTIIIIVVIALVFMLKKDNNHLEIPEKGTISGELSSGTGFKATYSVKKDTSKSVNFGVKNNSEVSVRISIDDKIHKTLAPGEEDNITTSSSSNKNYNFEVVPTPNGGIVNIEYEVSLIDN